MDDIQELYYLFPEIKEHIQIEKKVGQGCRFFSIFFLHVFQHNNYFNPQVLSVMFTWVIFVVTKMKK
jgi:hypothetical protein